MKIKLNDEFHNNGKALNKWISLSLMFDIKIWLKKFISRYKLIHFINKSVIVVFFVFSIACYADESDELGHVNDVVNEKTPRAENKDIKFESIYKNKSQQNAFSAANYVEIVLALALIVGLILVLAWALKRMNIPMMASAGKMRIQGSLSLGQREKLLIVNVENKRLLLGVTGSQISLIDRLPESEETSESKESFSVKLKSAIGKEDE